MNANHQQLLLDLARKSIGQGLTHNEPAPVDLSLFPEELRDMGCSFVTLEKGGELRGCIGSIRAHRPLATDIAENAYAAANRDPRFPPVEPDEAEALDIHISILNPFTPMEFEDENDLLARLRPGIDGLIMTEGKRQGLFLPSVWKSLPRPHDFLDHLKRKAGLPTDYWSDEINIERFTVEEFGVR